MKIIDSQPNVARIVEALKKEAAQRRSRLSLIIHGDRDKLADHRSDQKPLAPVRSGIQPSLNWNQATYDLEDLMAFDDEAFVFSAYYALLKRPPDAPGLANALEALRNEELDKVGLLLKLTASPEGREKGVKIVGLRAHQVARWLLPRPLLGRLAKHLYGLLEWRLVAALQERKLEALQKRQDQLLDQLNEELAPLHLLLKAFDDQIQLLKELQERFEAGRRDSEIRVSNETRQRLQQFDDRTLEIEDLRRVYNKYRTQVELTEKDLKREMAHLFHKHQEVKTELIHQSQRLGAIEENRSADPNPRALSSENDSGKAPHALDPFFASFDEHFRGNRGDVKQRLRAYLPFIRENGVGTPEAPLLDVASGRGEWLELLADEGLRASGVDFNEVLVSQCRARGLEVTHAELIGHLSQLAANSLGAVSAFHIVEHLTVGNLLAFLDQALRVLQPQGLLLLETPNPQNVMVGSCNFYFDPTHRHPLPTPVLSFMVESRGFVVLKTFGLNPSDEKPLANDSELAQRFNEYFYGPMDYAIVARKI